MSILLFSVLRGFLLIKTRTPGKSGTGHRKLQSSRCISQFSRSLWFLVPGTLGERNKDSRERGSPTLSFLLGKSSFPKGRGLCSCEQPCGACASALLPVGFLCLGTQSSRTKAWPRVLSGLSGSDLDWGLACSSLPRQKGSRGTEGQSHRRQWRVF